MPTVNLSDWCLELVMVLGLSAFASEKVQVTLSRVYDGDTVEIINEKNEKENICLNPVTLLNTNMFDNKKEGWY